MSDLSPADALHRFRQSQVRRLVDPRGTADALLGDSPAMGRLRAQVAAAAASGANVTIVGPEPRQLLTIAQAIHYRRCADGERPLVRVDAVMALPSELRRSLHLLEGGENDAGTLLIETIDHLPADQQAELLTAVAADDWRGQIVATRTTGAHIEPPAEGISDELAAVLATIAIEVPPLATRVEDIPLLAQRYLEELNEATGRAVSGYTDDALDRLMLYDWPGELPELREVIAAAHKTCTTGPITPADLPRLLQHAVEHAVWSYDAPEPIDLDAYLARVESLLVERAMELAGGNKAEAARLLGVSRPRLYRKLEQMGVIEPAPPKPGPPTPPKTEPDEPPPPDDGIEFVPVDGQ